MLYYLFEYLDKMDFPGAGVFQYITFRTAASVFVSLLISMVFGKRIIDLLRKQQVGETVRDLGLEGQKEKQGTPTMGGLIILASILIPTLLFAKLDNIYIILMLVSTVLLGLIGFLDDYIKVFKKNKEGLAGRFKVAGQVLIGILVGSVLYFNDDVIVKEKVYDSAPKEVITIDGRKVLEGNDFHWVETKSVVTTIPFVKDNEFDYGVLIDWCCDKAMDWAWLIFIPIVIFIITAVSNGANMTDGLDGLATGTSAIIGVALAVFAYVSGNTIFSDYLNIMYIPNSGELVVFIGAFVGACVGFLWYNSYPAQVFMGDTGSLALGGIIAVFALAIRKELLIPVICGVFLVENLSVVIQVGYFKYTKKKFGEGKRVFLMAPLHHHFQKKGFHESKIVSRFWIVGVMLAILSIVTLKLR
ncbi:MAG: phospho-N-acetylmuramoyl-pentapeptide-transferase [Bacteroidetes bacterium]|nr:MAG: phospho-N-acetylmuramoyl-pentapeptide-transferase [Bacteroidota bacterium]MBL1145736.1 phospho-N-acetylmuramoyl-pentapeptide-transferase [Bacteroidota bacterium]MCB0803229.1 phospho-N-acetylmuramoyl-pentapeptide-transferase [Flavobacteriales bacterium]NOG58530.1 phospho-N-acetylmuramoyl-pentapeptide-transferase [Bacteroidota bacterium]